MADSANPLWQFSLDFYRRPGIESLCIQLQDEHGDDVNLLLLCCWGAVQGLELSRDYFATLLADVTLQHWRTRCIEPLRRLRRELKPLSLEGADSLRASVKNLELQAEKLQQDYLLRSLSALTGAAEAGNPLLLVANLRNYRAALGRGPLQQAEVLAFLGAAYPNICSAELTALAAVSRRV